MKYVFYTLLILAVFIVPDFIQRKRREKRIRKYINRVWGQDETRLEGPIKDFEPVFAFYENMKKRGDQGFLIDDITWNDLNMDEVYNRINHTMSVCGEQYLYYMLRRTLEDPSALKKRMEQLDLFQKHTDQCQAIQYLLMLYGKNRQYDFSRYFFESSGKISESNIRYIVQALVLVLSPLLLLIDRSFGVVIALSLAFNIITHYTRSKQIRKNTAILTWMVELLKYAGKVEKKNFPILKDYPIKETLKKIQSAKIKGIHYIIFESQNVLLEYFKAVFLAELIVYGKYMKLLESKREAFLELYSIIGQIDATISIVSARETFPVWCEPEFNEKGAMSILQEKAYHPLIRYPVPNDLDMNQCILISGSNASGKSTFLKTIAVNAIFSQSICTCLAKRYKGSIVNVYTSMALRDDIISEESYYIVEIRSLKRILDAVSEKNNVLCFVDEVLRGTNTIERIAASSEILKHFSRSGVLCMAATHDLELADILAGLYENYHFQEYITEDNITFDYILYKDKTHTRNAIQLLRLMGYEPEIVQKADLNAKRFMETGMWK